MIPHEFFWVGVALIFLDSFLVRRKVDKIEKALRDRKIL
jgi:hypothetical protein